MMQRSASGKRLDRRSRFHLQVGIAVVLLLVLVGVARHLGGVSADAMIAMSIGGTVGFVELLGRYRHAPARAVLTLSGIAYVAINMVAALSAYYILDAFEVFKTTTTAKDLLHVLTAGLGSLVVMRSSIFKVKVGDSDVGIGPAAVLDTLLLVADRGVDRREAVARAQDVSELIARVQDPQLVARMLTKYCLALMQNVDAKTSGDVSEAVNKIMADRETPDAIKIDIVALSLGSVVGPNVLEAAVTALGDRLNATMQREQRIPSATALQAEIEAWQRSNETPIGPEIRK